MVSSPAPRRWWADKVGRFVSYARAKVSDAERAELAAWLAPAQLRLFESMQLPDQRHGLDVARSLRLAGHGADVELIVAGLLHDAGKGREVRLWHRIAWSLGQRYGRWIVRLGGVVPGARPVFERLERHPAISAELARAAGVSERAGELIAQQAAPRDPAAVALHFADEGELGRAGKGPR